MRKYFKKLKDFNWSLFVSLCALALVPALYQTIKTLIISENNQSSVFDIIGQMEWFDLINETLKAFLIIPLYSVLNKIYKKDEKIFSEYVLKIGLIVFIIYTIFSVIVLFSGITMLKGMNTEEIDINLTNHYLQLETIGFMIEIIISYVMVVFVVIGKSKNVYVVLVVKTIMSLIMDFILIPKLGVYGIAISNIVVNLILSIICLVVLYKQKYISFFKNNNDNSIFREWIKIGVYSGLSQFIDNFIYTIMVCKMVNRVSEQGNYWIANNFIWGLLLIPITALSEVIRHDCKTDYKNLRKENYYFIVIITILIWAISISLWEPYYKYAQRLDNSKEIFIITLKLVPFYIAYGFTTIIDNIFIGLGKTKYTTINSLIVNLGYYGIFYLLYITKTITFTMNTIILMFGIGMIVHWIISIVEEKIFNKKIKEEVLIC